MKRRNKVMIKSKLVLSIWFAMSVVTLGSLLFNLSPERRKSVRELEKVSTKLVKQKCSLLFKSTCLKEDILPNDLELMRIRSGAQKVS